MLFKEYVTKYLWVYLVERRSLFIVAFDKWWAAVKSQLRVREVWLETFSELYGRMGRGSSSALLPASG